MPRLEGEANILIMGSENGLGKTSIIECCSLLLLAIGIDGDEFDLKSRYSSFDVSDLLIRSGAELAEISGTILVNNKPIKMKLKITRKGIVEIMSKNKYDKNFAIDHSRDNASNLVKAICGFTPNPVIEKMFLLFHSYRKIEEGNPEIGMMVEEYSRNKRMQFHRRIEEPLSIFKLQILKALMSKADLFEHQSDVKPDKTIDKLNELVSSYANGELSKLRSLPDNTVDFRVTPNVGGESIPFDGLSSGQKEIISTLFLVWHHTKDTPAVVFIDEPELHLNDQWHRSFIDNLISIAPENQYIIATHSVDIMDSVNADKRILLLKEENVSK